MKTQHRNRKGGKIPKHSQVAMTLAEVMVALAISGLSIAGIVNGYTFCTNSAQRNALSLAATTRAIERIEETRSAQWKAIVATNLDKVFTANFTNRTVVLDVSGSGKQS